MKSGSKAAGFLLVSFLATPALFGGLNTNSSTASMKVYEDGPRQLVVYTDVPGWNSPTNSKIKSPFYTIKVRSAATSNQWVECFPLYTYNRANELPDIPDNTGTNSPVHTQGYQDHTGGWSQSYANIEMTTDTAVEVEIGRVGTNKIVGVTNIFKAAVHPAQKVSSQSNSLGKAYFTITNPCQVVIDINGQMDDYNAVLNPLPGDPPVHTVTLFANPVMTKPATNGPGILAIVPGSPQPATNEVNIDPGTYTTMVFLPGVHRIGQSFKIHPGRTYYIPGDAYVFGTIGNTDLGTEGYRSSGDSITIHGYGTFSGVEFPHNKFRYAYTNLPSQGTLGDRSIVTQDSVNLQMHGVTVVDPANFSVDVTGWSGRNLLVPTNAVRWVKAISWRLNGDGLGGVDLMEDCFIRSHDDSTYVVGHIRRCTLWKDSHARMFRLIRLPENGDRYPYVLEDCDVIYNRTRTGGGLVGSVFSVSGNTTSERVAKTDVTIRNFRFHDRRSNMEVFDLESDPTSYTGLKFENIALKLPGNGMKQSLLGSSNAPWFGSPVFKNVTFDDGTNNVLLTRTNFGTYFQTNQFVYPLFDDPQNLALTTTNTDANQGYVIPNPDQATYPEGSSITLTAVARPGYTFSHWSGDASGTNNPLTVVMFVNQNITANFVPADINLPVVVTSPDAGTWTIPPGVYSATFQVWGGGGAGGSAYNGDTSLANTQARGGGGAGGGYAGTTLAVTPGQTVDYTNGAGGIGAAAGFVHNSSGATGGTSVVRLNGTTIVSARGGPGGRNISVTNAVGSGSGGIAFTSGNIGSNAFYGGNGATANANGTGGGGGSAGSSANGTNAPSPSAGSAPGGAGGAGGGATGGAGLNSTVAGNAGGTPGAGGAGAAVRSTAFAYRTGGTGGDGKIIVTYNTMLFTVNTSATNGSIALNPSGGIYRSGTNVTVSATPNPGYLFAGWSGALAGATNPATLLMDGNKTLTAVFARPPQVTSITMSGAGTTLEIGATNLEPVLAYELQHSTTLSSWSTVNLSQRSNVTEGLWTIQPLPPGPGNFFRVIKRN